MRASCKCSIHDCRALHFAASSLGSTEVLEVLIAYGANVDCLNEDHATPLFFACQTNNQLAASLLLNCGANFRAQNLHGEMAKFWELYG